MGKNDFPLLSALSPDAIVKDAEADTAIRFIGTENPRYVRVLNSLELRAQSRKEIDRVAGASNGPQVVANLRALGLTIPCDMIPAIDRDGYPTRFGVYSLDDADRAKISLWSCERERKTRRASHEE
jgi:hypothetical protein